MLRLVFIDHCAWRRYVGFFRAWFSDSLLHRERGRLYLGSCSFRHVEYHFDLEACLAIGWFKSVAMTTMNPANRYFCSFLFVPCTSFGFLACTESIARILGLGFRSWPQQAGNLQWHILQQFLGAKGLMKHVRIPSAAADKEWYVEGGWHGAANRGNSMRELCRECYVWWVPGHNFWLSEVSLQRSRNQHVSRRQCQ